MKKMLVWLAVFGCTCAWAQAGEVTLQFTFNDQDITYQPRDAFEKIFMQDCVLPEDAPGTPWLPAKFINVLIPSGAKVTEVRAAAEESLLRSGIQVYPVQPPQKRSGARTALVPPSAAAYTQVVKTPASQAVLAGEHIMSGFSFASVRINPLRYSPAAQQLFLARQIQVTVVYAEPRARLSAPAAQQAAAAAWVSGLVVNGDTQAAFAPEVARSLKADTTAQYLLITRQTYSNAFNALVQHRAARFNSKLLTIETITNTYTGTDIQTRIRNCIKDYWQNHGTLYVVLGGDDTIVPDRDTKVSVDSDVESAMPTDLYYSGLDGTWDANGNGVYGEVTDSADMAWEVIVGRIPVRTAAQATDYINKLIAYETTPPTHLAKKIILGGMVAWDTYTGTDRPSDDATADGHAGFRASNHPSVSDSEAWGRRLYRDGIRPYWQATTIGIFCDTLTSWDTSTAGDYLENATNVRKRFNEGWWHLFFSGHGDVTAWGLESGAFYSSDATALTNKALFCYTDACLTGHFDGSTDPCLSEAFLRNASGGALIYIGCSRYGWGEPDEAPASNTSDGGPSTVYAYKYYKRLYQSNDVTCGRAFAMHKADMISQCSANGSERWIQFGLNLQGDPAILPNPASQPAQSAPYLPAIGAKSTAVGQALQFTVVAQKTDGDTITNLWATGLPTGATFTPVNSANTNGTFSWANPAAAGSYSVTFWAGDNDGVASISVSITVTNAGSSGGTATIRAQGFEGAAGDTWTYTATPGSGTIGVSTERAMTGSKSLKFAGSNKLNSDPYVEFANTDISTYTGVKLAIGFASSGPDSDDDLYLDLSYDNGATWTGAGSVKLVDGYGNGSLAFGAVNALNPTTVAANPWIVNIPAGTAQIKVRVRFDEKLGSGNISDYYFIDDVILTGTAGGSTPQSPPILAAIGNKSVQVSNSLAFTVSAAATDGDAITNLWATGLPAGATFTPAGGNTSGTFSWPSPNPAGAYNVTFWAGDNDGSDSETITITVTNPPAGGATTAIKFQGFESAAGDNWTYASTPGSGSIIVNSDRCYAGTRCLRLTGSSTQNSDPYVVFENVSLAGYGSVQLSLAFAASGPDADDDLYLDLSYDNGATWNGAGSIKLVDGYSGANIAFGAVNAANPTTVGSNPWVVNIPAGTAQIKVRVRFDEKGTAANTSDHYYLDNLQLTGIPSGGTPQTPPVLAAIGNKSVQASNSLSFAVNASATDGDTITNLWATGLPAGATFIPAGGNTSGTFTWSSAQPAGAYNVTFWAGDNDGVDYETITITVTNPPSGGGGLTTLKFQGFEGAAADTWAYTSTPGAGTIASVSDRYMSGAKSLRLSGSAKVNADPFVVFDNVSIAGQSDVKLQVAFSASGPDSSDDLYLDISYDNGSTWTGEGSCKLVDGYGNANVAFGAINGSNPTTVGANPWIVNIPAGTAQIKVRIRYDELGTSSNNYDHYYIDDIKLTSGSGARRGDGRPNIWINEVDYDSYATDSNEWVELCGAAGLSLNDYELVGIGISGAKYQTFDLAPANFTFSDECNGFGFFVIGIVAPEHGTADYTPASWTLNELYNTTSNALWLREKATSNTVHLIDYCFNNGFTAEDQITGVADTGTARSSIFLTGGPGSGFASFSWTNTAGYYTPGAVNSNQALMSVATPTVIITSPATSPFVISHGVTVLEIAGVCNAFTEGIQWENAATSESGAGTLAGTNWSANVPIEVGANLLTITGTNTAGQSHSATVSIWRRPADAIIFGDDFEDGDLAGWTPVQADDWANATVTPIAGVHSLKHNPPAPSGTNYSYVFAQPIYSVAANDTIWRFNLKNGAWDPSSYNRFWVYLMANEDNLTNHTVDGYAIGVNFSMASDTVTLWRVTNGTNNQSLIKTSLQWDSDMTVGFEVTRTIDGQWSIKLDANGGFDNLIPAGATTDVTHTDSAFFGLVFQYTSGRAGSLWMDDVEIRQAELNNSTPAVFITSPAASLFTVPNMVTEAALAGICNANVAGQLAWNNDLNGASGLVPASATWTIGAIPLATGTNLITLTATNASGAAAVDTLAIVRRFDLAGASAIPLGYQGFETAAEDTLNYVAQAGAGTIEVSDNRCRTGFRSIKLTGSAAEDADPRVEFANVDLSHYENAQVAIAFSAMGPDAGDDLYLDLSYDNGLSWDTNHSVKLVSGFRGLEVAFEATSSMTVPANPYTYELPEGVTQVKIRVRYDEGASSDNTSDSYFVDDIQISAEEMASDDDDGDGLDDAWETAIFGSINAPNASADANPDNDALSNLEEYILDLNPADEENPDDLPLLTGYAENGAALLSFPSSTRRFYTIQYNPTLADAGAWVDLPAQAQVRGTGAVMSIELDMNSEARHYRIMVTAP